MITKNSETCLYFIKKIISIICWTLRFWKYYIKGTANICWSYTLGTISRNRKNVGLHWFLKKKDNIVYHSLELFSNWFVEVYFFTSELQHQNIFENRVSKTIKCWSVIEHMHTSIGNVNKRVITKVDCCSCSCVRETQWWEQNIYDVRVSHQKRNDHVITYTCHDILWYKRSIALIPGPNPVKSSVVNRRPNHRSTMFLP